MADPGERGRGGRPPPLFLDQTEARRAKNIFGGDRAPSLSQCLDSALVMVSEWSSDPFYAHPLRGCRLLIACVPPHVDVSVDS